jgi:hypothetical protein
MRDDIRSMVADGLRAGTFLVMVFVQLYVAFGLAGVMNRKLLLWSYYGRDVVNAEDLRFVRTVSGLVVSNGDVLPPIYTGLYLSCQFVCGGLSVATFWIVLWALDRRLLSGRLLRLCIDQICRISSREDSGQSAAPAFAHRVDVTRPDAVTLRLQEAIDGKHGASATLVFPDT